MVDGKGHQTLIRFTLVLVAAFLTMFGFVSSSRFRQRLMCPPRSQPIRKTGCGSPSLTKPCMQEQADSLWRS